MSFSDYIIYADESGSPVLGADQDDFPIFVLVFVLVKKDHYISAVVPALQRLKFDFVGHDQLILHERDIRRQSKDFAFLQRDVGERENFLQRTNDIIQRADIEICCAVIDKAKLRSRYSDPWDPYALAITFCMEEAALRLSRYGQHARETTVVLEARGNNEDRQLELEMARVARGSPRIGRPLTSVQQIDWKPRFCDKRCNSSGLQLADLAARPLGLSYLRPDQTNRAAEILRTKLCNGRFKSFP
ncbi:DUF3800 domain-containing protein [Paracoccus sediminicola]|uniref:DUF3800 domain-containing protein n=1 Tax=Paracoccus sediminicola TaxID=3017783 RepID=UPI0022EFF237|nr:DUF3800 domain-containing protein [Paracoccus sediminicola]WBU56045.1 DUF3800 domain-containing protein [Paracoccus sediminicola]